MPRRPSLNGRKKLVDKTAGPFHMVWEARDQALAIYSKQERDAVVIYALEEAARYWLEEHYAKRFKDKNVAQRLGWSEGDAYGKRKLKKMNRDLPNVYSGQMAQQVSKNTEFVGRAGDDPSVTIRIPQPHPLAAGSETSLTSFPAEEVEAVARKASEIIVELGNARATTDYKGKPTLSSEVRAQVGLKARQRAGRKLSYSRLTPAGGKH